jgi:hypothetical protein
MSSIISVVALLLCFVFAALPPLPFSRQTEPRKRETFSALAVLPSGAGPRMVGAGSTVNATIYIEDYSSDDDVRQAAGALTEGGQDALVKVLEKMKPKGKVTTVGRVGFYDLKLIRSIPSGEGRQILAALDRPISFLEAYNMGRSTDYKIGVLQLSLKENSKGKEEGEGQLIYSAKVKIEEGNKVVIENYGITPIQLRGVREL